MLQLIHDLKAFCWDPTKDSLEILIIRQASNETFMFTTDCMQ